jgi:hypothetical protein
MVINPTSVDLYDEESHVQILPGRTGSDNLPSSSRPVIVSAKAYVWYNQGRNSGTISLTSTRLDSIVEGSRC